MASPWDAIVHDPAPDREFGHAGAWFALEYVEAHAWQASTGSQKIETGSTSEGTSVSPIVTELPSPSWLKLF